jgi:2-oxoglutarate ferredoxin oxidoreductase subunit gamma
MEKEKQIIIAGYGGQGIVFAGQILATAAMKEGHYVTVLPSYGPEMRGGTANCTVVISPEEVYSPVVENPNVLIVLNQPSLDRFEALVKTGGSVLVNASLASPRNRRADLSYCEVKASDIATSLGDLRVANVVAVAALNSAVHLVKPEPLRAALQELLAQKKSKLLELNLKALEEGATVGAMLRQHSGAQTEL